MIEKLSLIQNPSYVKIEYFIKKLFITKLQKIVEDIDRNVEYDFVFDYNSGIKEPMAVNENGKITFKIKTISKYMALLDTRITQETFLAILLTHELLHSIVKRSKIDSSEYEYMVNQWTKKIVTDELPVHSYRALLNATKRIKFGNECSAEIKDSILNALLFPIKKGEYWIHE